MRRAPAFRKPPTNCTGALHPAIAMLSFVSRVTIGKRSWQLSGHPDRLILALLVSLLLTLSASAETVAETARNWGLIGPWSRDCSLKPGRDQATVLAYEIMANERVVHRRNFGDTTDENEVVTAEISGDGMLNLRVFFPNFKQTREYGLMKQPDGSIRTMYNHDQKDEYSIRDGIFTANGNPTPLLHKCR
jgi:hypothetical protein